MTDLLRFYDTYDEANRLERGTNRLEYARTLELLGRFLLEVPATVLDIGGGTGVYARLLLTQGHIVHLLDASPRHVGAVQADPALAGLASLTLGDARQLPYPDQSANTVLLLGPLYHLTERAGRLSALREAHRCLKPGGLLLAAAITRPASVLDHLFSGFDADPLMEQMVRSTVQDGHHRPPDRSGWFMHSYFHRPEELTAEVEQAGFGAVEVYATEGVGGLLGEDRFEAIWSDPAARERLLDTLRLLERDPSLLGASPHLLAVGYRPQAPAAAAIMTP